MQGGTDSSKQAPLSGMTRAALLGLAGGLLLGGGFLVFQGFKALFLPPDCEGLSGLECDLLTQTAGQVGRMQLLLGSVFLVLGLLIVLLRPRPSAR